MGLYQLAMHPIETLSGTVNAVLHPIDTYKIIAINTLRTNYCKNNSTADIGHPFCSAVAISINHITLYQLAMHPIETLSGTVNAVLHPIDTYKIIAKDIERYLYRLHTF
jgi:hypothetical protein